MAASIRKIVVFLSLIAFTLSSIIGLVGGLQVTTILMRASIVFIIFAAVGMVLTPVFIQLWGESTSQTTEQYTFGDQEESSNDES